MAARRHVLLLFDLSFSAPPAILKAREAARKFVLESLHPSDLVALATHSVERGPQLVVTFTPDRVQLARAIDHLGAPRFMNSMSDPLKFVLPAYESQLDRMTSSDDGNGQTSSEVRGMQESVLGYLRVIGKQMAKVETSYSRGRVASWSQSMGVLASALDSVQGRKHVVYFSEGFDGRLLLGRQPDGSRQGAAARPAGAWRAAITGWWTTTTFSATPGCSRRLPRCWRSSSAPTSYCRPSTSPA